MTTKKLINLNTAHCWALSKLLTDKGIFTEKEYSEEYKKMRKALKCEQ